MPIFRPPNIEKLREKRDVDGLIKALRGKDPVVRRDAADALGEIGDERAVEALVEAGTSDTLHMNPTKLDDLATVHNAIASALRKIGVGRAVELLAAKLKTRARSRAAWLLGELQDPRAVPPLLEVLSEPFGPRSDAIGALGKLGDARAIEPLLAVIRRATAERAYGDRSKAIDALGLIGDPSAAGPLVATAGSDAAVIQALRQMGALDALGDPNSLITTLRSGSYPEGDRLAAVFALKDSRDPRAVEALVEVALTDDTSESVRRAAEKAVISMANPHAVALLTAALGRREVERDTTLQSGKRMLHQLVDTMLQQLSAEDLLAVARLEDGERTVKCLGWEWDSYNEEREWVSGTVPIEFQEERALAEAELARRGTPK
jgi:HEAT repeat protein